MASGNLSREELLRAVEAQRDLMISVATDGPRIKEVNPQYIERRSVIRKALSALGLEDPNPYQDLWMWHGKWSSGDLPSYASRRAFISSMYADLIDALSSGEAGGTVQVREPTGWQRVDRAVDKARQRLASAKHEEDFQQVGLLCREVLISLAQAVYDPAIHESLDGKSPSGTDAKRMLEAYIAKELSGGSNDEMRKYARAAIDLANNLQHKRTAAFRTSAMCVEATMSVVNSIAIASGRHDPEP